MARWVDGGKRWWNFQSGIAFSANKPTYYVDAKTMPDSGISAGLANYPGLLHGGEIMANDGNTDAKQKIRATRAAFGFDDTMLYLIVVYDATVVEAAHVAKGLGARDALNLDGGGSTALYENGKYLAGPGRPVPNAIVLKH
jgi:exopolysaccharide biosynthesis protein